MKIFLENINTNSSSGPNSFAKKMFPYLTKLGCSFSDLPDADVSLCFIESNIQNLNIPRIQRLDGIYFNTTQDYNYLNLNIKKTYDSSQGIVFQSEFNKCLITKWFGEPDKYTIIHNGADLNSIEKAVQMKNNKYENIWCCAASWRPHKRLNENVDYFLQHKGENDLLIVAGEVPPDQRKIDNSIVYFGNLSQNQLYSLYKASKYFLHLAWLDHCPNVVVDARSSGCHIICSSAGGTKEIAGLNSTIIEEEDWDYSPIELYNPPKLNFARKKHNIFDSSCDMMGISKKYKEFMEMIHASSS